MVVTGRSRKAFAGNRTWVRIPPFPPISEIDLLLDVYFAIAKVGFERRAFPERIARNQKCEAGRLDCHLFRSSGGIRTPSISRANSEEKEMRRPDDWYPPFPFLKEGAILSADCCSQSNFALLVLLYNKLR